MTSSGPPARRRLVSSLPEWAGHDPARAAPLIGVLRGEGIGPEIIDACLRVLGRVSTATGRQFDIQTGGKIGVPAQAESGCSLTPQVIDFCADVFQRHGAILCGPGGGRFVYDLRAHFDLYCKFTPILPVLALADVGPIRPEALAGVDIVIVRENTGGLYFGDWKTIEHTERSAVHSFCYTETQVRRILAAAIHLARARRGRLCVALKPGGVPTISALWAQQLGDLVRGHPVQHEILEVDNAMYQLIAQARRFDVIVAPNMFGDVLSDGASLLLGSRGLSYSGNFGAAGCAVYQTGHGAAHDLAGTDRANPVGQILSLAMMLRESFGLGREAAAIEAAVSAVFARGSRTADIATPNGTVVGTRELGDLIACEAESRLLAHR